MAAVSLSVVDIALELKHIIETNLVRLSLYKPLLHIYSGLK